VLNRYLDTPLRKIAALVALLNLGYFGIEFAVALKIGSVSLFADSVDFLEDASVNLLILLALGWSLKNRARVGIALSLTLMVPGIATLLAAYQSFVDPAPPQPFLLTITGAGALAINLSCALMLAAFRHESGSLTKAAFLSARNDALANIAIMGAGFVINFVWNSGWPDLIVGLGIAAVNMDAAREVWEAAQNEYRTAA
jgi:Co/Zn/Cd efflux system component